MNLLEALSIVKEGKVDVCHESWSDHRYLFLNEKFGITDSAGGFQAITMGNIPIEYFEGWKVWEEPLHSFEWALVQIRGGDKVCHVDWTGNHHLSCDSPPIFNIHISDILEKKWKFFK